MRNVSLITLNIVYSSVFWFTRTGAVMGLAISQVVRSSRHAGNKINKWNITERCLGKHVLIATIYVSHWVAHIKACGCEFGPWLHYSLVGLLSFRILFRSWDCGGGCTCPRSFQTADTDLHGNSGTFAYHKLHNSFLFRDEIQIRVLVWNAHTRLGKEELDQSSEHGWATPQPFAGVNQTLSVFAPKVSENRDHANATSWNNLISRLWPIFEENQKHDKKDRF